jgi:peptidoglycan/xylan/chitin deacetylase (PgdA/CDA1 family)
MMNLAKIKYLAKVALYYGGYYALSHSLTKSGNKSLLILMYHDLRDEGISQDGRKTLGDRPTREQFEAHLEALGNRVRVISLEQAIQEIREKGVLSHDSAAITFDDGYASVYSVAYPLLKKRNWPATVFLTTDWINRKTDLWWEKLADMIGRYDPKTIDYARIKQQLGDPLENLLRITNGAYESRHKALAKIESYFKQQSDEVIQEATARLERVLFPDGYHFLNQVSPLNWDEIRIMANSGINFGAHTCSHPNLSRVSLEKAEAEIVCCKMEIEKQIAKKALGFAYPYGDDPKNYIRLEPFLRRHEFLYACAASEGSNNGDNYFALARHTLPCTTSKALLSRILYLNFRAISKPPKIDDQGK